jgi:hypothetical protein
MSKSDWEIEVVGSENSARHNSRRRPLRPVRTALRAALLRPRFLRLCLVGGFLLLIGTPHVGWDYECRHGMRGPGTCRAVHWCAYYGIQGRRIEFPDDGQSCKLVTFIPLDFQKLLGG